ncbi:MAG: metallophosphoesterase [Agarilytica sp.]
MRIFSCSDVHLDYEENVEWLLNLSRWDFVQDTLILPGDISDATDKVSFCFDQLKRRFQHVVFVPGNHDVWVKASDPFDSLDKFESLLALAEEYEVLTEPVRINDTMIAPIFSWYDFSFSKPSEYIRKAWMDFRRCRWPEPLREERQLCQYFLSRSKKPQGNYENLITCSHFLPRIDVMPCAIPAKKRELYSVLGAHCIDEHIRALGADIHIYGHSHVNRDLSIDGVRYINNALGYPNEIRITRKKLLHIV